jgi:ABC-type uncharacterized transport system permease subunit
MSLIVFFVGMVIVLLVPIMLGARMVGANNTGFGAALVAVLALTFVNTVVDKFVTNQLLAFLVSGALGSFLLAGILGTTFWRAVAVSVIATAIFAVIVVLFAGAMLAKASVS